MRHFAGAVHVGYILAASCEILLSCRTNNCPYLNYAAGIGREAGDMLDKSLVHHKAQCCNQISFSFIAKTVQCSRIFMFGVSRIQALFRHLQGT